MNTSLHVHMSFVLVFIPDVAGSDTDELGVYVQQYSTTFGRRIVVNFSSDRRHNRTRADVTATEQTLARCLVLLIFLYKLVYLLVGFVKSAINSQSGCVLSYYQTKKEI